MTPITARGFSTPGLLTLLLWAGNAHAAPCQNNIPASNPDSVYVDHGNGTVTDRRTGLMWKQCAEGLSGATCQTGSAQSFTWANALAHAEASTFANYTDWRLPNVKELSSLVEDCRAGPAINTNRFPNTPTAHFWSGSPSEYKWIYMTWSVVFTDGAAVYNERGLSYHVRLVRSGREAAAVLRPGESYAGVTFGPHGTISVGSTTLFQERLLGISNFDYFYLRVYGEGVRIVELYEVAEDLSVNLNDPLLATALVSAGGDVLEETIFPGN